MYFLYNFALCIECDKQVQADQDMDFIAAERLVAVGSQQQLMPTMPLEARTVQHVWGPICA